MKTIQKYSYVFLAGVLFLPQLSFAASCSAMPNDTFSELVSKALCIINSSLVPLAFSIAILVFLWGLVNFVARGADEEARKKGKDFMIWGIIALAVMVMVWGFVNLLVKTANLNNSGTITVPEAPTFTPAG